MTLVLLGIHPKTPADAQRLARALQQLTAEDSALVVRSGQIPGHVVIGGSSEQHLEVVVDRLKRDFDVEATLGRPEVAYREAIRRAADGEAKYARHTSGRGHYGHVKIRIHPGEPGTGYVFDDLSDGTIPAEFMPAVAEGIKYRLASGVLAGHPIQDVRVEVHDGSYHDEDSSETSFRIAASLAVEEALRNAEPVLLEPLMRVEVLVPPEYSADIVKSLLSRRGQIQSIQDGGATRAIRALVPLAELFGYASDRQFRTQGRATFAMQFEAYVPVQPPEDGERDSVVGVPRKPAPRLKEPGIALPEPDEDDRKEDTGPSGGRG